jgi:hypothetical protein
LAISFLFFRERERERERMCGSDALQALSQTSMWDEHASGVLKVSACACEFVRKVETQREWIYVLGKESPYYQVMAKTKGFLPTNNILTHHLKTKKLKKLKCC